MGYIFTGIAFIALVVAWRLLRPKQPKPVLAAQTEPVFDMGPEGVLDYMAYPGNSRDPAVMALREHARRDSEIHRA